MTCGDVGNDETTARFDAYNGGRAEQRESDILARLLRGAREFLGMDVAFVSEFVDGQRVFRYVDAPEWSPIEAGGSDPLEDSYCLRVVDGRLPSLIGDAQQFPTAAELPATSALPVGAHVSVPLMLGDGTLYGTFCCFSRRADHSLTGRDLAIVRMFADVARHYLEPDIAAGRERDEARARVTAALTTDGFLTTVYQPVVGLRDGALVGVEALSRFPPAFDRPPDVWFREAASLGLGVDLELLAVRRATEALPELPESAFLSVNVSPAVVISGRLPEAVAHVDGDRLVLEMTEHAPVADYAALGTALEPLRRRGVRVAVDDAGAGFASLRHILRLEPEWIKVDASITEGVDVVPAQAAMATALVAFGQRMGVGVIAEGIETADQLTALQELGVTAGQGYHLARPGPLAVARLGAPARAGVTPTLASSRASTPRCWWA